MSRKSRQRDARKLLFRAIPFTWMAVIMLIGGLWLVTFGFLSPWISKPIPLEDTIPVSATMTRVEGDYEFHRKHRRLDTIRLYFEDHDPLMFDSILAHETLLDKLKAYPAGTVFDMRLELNGIDIMTLSVDGKEVFSYAAACRAITVNSYFGIVAGIIMLPITGYAAWSLFIRWKYRKLT